MWALSGQEGRKIEVFEMMCLRNICGVRRGRVENSRNVGGSKV